MSICMYVFCVYKLLPYKTRSLSVPHTCLCTFIHTYIHTYIQADSLSKEFHKSLVVNMSLKEELLKLRRRHEEVISTLQWDCITDGIILRASLCAIPSSHTHTFPMPSSCRRYRSGKRSKRRSSWLVEAATALSRPWKGLHHPPPPPPRVAAVLALAAGRSGSTGSQTRAL